jgi:hypothetical protein
MSWFPNEYPILGPWGVRTSYTRGVITTEGLRPDGTVLWVYRMVVVHDHGHVEPGDTIELEPGMNEWDE